MAIVKLDYNALCWDWVCYTNKCFVSYLMPQQKLSHQQTVTSDKRTPSLPGQSYMTEALLHPQRTALQCLKSAYQAY